MQLYGDYNIEHMLWDLLSQLLELRCCLNCLVDWDLRFEEFLVILSIYFHHLKM